jgi:hypothetical protein
MSDPQQLGSVLLRRREGLAWFVGAGKFGACAADWLVAWSRREKQQRNSSGIALRRCCTVEKWNL